MDIIINLYSINPSMLDRGIQQIIAGVPANEYADMTIQVREVQIRETGRFLVRKIIFTAPTSKAVAALAKIDVLRNVEITVR